MCWSQEFAFQEQITERIINAPTRWENIDDGELQEFPILKRKISVT
jgi:hypothetical protein